MVVAVVVKHVITRESARNVRFSVQTAVGREDSRVTQNQNLTHTTHTRFIYSNYDDDDDDDVVLLLLLKHILHASAREVFVPRFEHRSAVGIAAPQMNEI